MPIDISKEFIFNSAGSLQLKFPAVDIRVIVGDMKMNYPVPVQYESLKQAIFTPIQQSEIMNRFKQ